MKNIIILIALVMGFSSNINAEKYGLIIAVGDYPESGGWPDISSHNDIPHVKGALHALGFKDSNIAMIQDEEATRDGILKAFEELNKRISKKDVIFIHFSGHGQQVVDDNGDELDNLDEAIVPYNSAVEWVEGFNEGQFLIRDDLLGEWTNKYRAKVGKKGQVVLILDSCHSGSGTRGMGLARGTDKIMAPANFTKTRGDGKEKSMGLTPVNDAELAPMASFFGASSRELNYEAIDDQDRPVGSLTFALYSIIAKMNNAYSFQELFERLSLKMKTIAPNQSPQWEGPSDVYFLGGEINKSERLYNVDKFIDQQKLVALVGTMSDVYEGAKVELLSVDLDKTVAKGTISKALLNQSEIVLDEVVDFDETALYKVKITERSNAPVRCLINSDIKTSSKWAQVKEDVLSAPFLQIQEQNPEIIITEKNNESIVLETRDGIVLYESEYNKKKESKVSYDLKNAIRGYSQGKYLRAYENTGSRYNVSMEIVEVECDNPNNQIQFYNENDKIIPVGTCIKLKITNNGLRPAYFSVLDIQPDNVINVIIPAENLGYTPDEYYLEPGASFLTDYSIEIGEPYGDEVLKLISSNKPLDLSGVIKTKGSSTRGNTDSHPFEQMMSATYLNTSSRGASVRKPSIEELGTETVYFTIVKK